MSWTGIALNFVVTFLPAAKSFYNGTRPWDKNTRVPRPHVPQHIGFYLVEDSRRTPVIQVGAEAPDGVRWRCSASLVRMPPRSPQNLTMGYVLTAAHCVDATKRNESRQLAQRAWMTSGPFDGTRFIDVAVHPNYNRSAPDDRQIFPWDVALLRFVYPPQTTPNQSMPPSERQDDSWQIANGTRHIEKGDPVIFFGVHGAKTVRGYNRASAQHWDTNVEVIYKTGEKATGHAVWGPGTSGGPIITGSANPKIVGVASYYGHYDEHRLAGFVDLTRKEIQSFLRSPTFEPLGASNHERPNAPDFRRSRRRIPKN
ncbi:MAG: trypsin-like serine protease [Myxococcota bacterium]